MPYCLCGSLGRGRRICLDLEILYPDSDLARQPVGSLVRGPKPVGQEVSYRLLGPDREALTVADIKRGPEWLRVLLLKTRSRLVNSRPAK